MAKNKSPTKPTMKNTRHLNSHLPEPEKPPKPHNPKPTKSPKKHHQSAKKLEKAPKTSPKMEKPQSWASFRSLITCKHLQTQPQVPLRKQRTKDDENDKKMKKMKCSGSLCNNTKIMQSEHHHHEPISSSSYSPNKLNKKKETASSSMSSSSNNINGGESSSSGSSRTSISMKGHTNNNNGGFMVMPFRRFSGCYECRMIVDPVLGFTRDPSLRATICTCPQCGEIFMKPDNLELHQAVRHAVSELGPEDTSKNIVEIIFQSSWLKKQTPVCKIDRILKVQNTPKTISKFEAYRDSIKSKSNKKHPRCLADGNELLRFHSTSFLCSLGLNGSSNLCNSFPDCSVCSIIKSGFRIFRGEKGILTTATSGRAHDSAIVVREEERRAMLVCRVIAGRVKKSLSEDNDEVAVGEGKDEDDDEEYDSIAGATGVYSNLDELYVFSPRAILPCFVVVYRGF